MRNRFRFLKIPENTSLYPTNPYSQEFYTDCIPDSKYGILILPK